MFDILLEIFGSILFIVVGSMFAFFPDWVDKKNKNDFQKLYQRLNFSLFKTFADSVETNPSNSLLGRFLGTLCLCIGIYTLARNILALL